MLWPAITFLLWCSRHIAISEGCDQGNVALGKTAYQSGTSSGGIASRAVDGGVSQNYIHGSCTHTTSSTTAFWEVDLGQLYFIDHVTIYNRQDCCADRLRDVQLLIGKEKDSYTLLGYHDGIVGSTYTFQLKHVFGGKWVRITQNVSLPSPLSLCEVEVFGQLYHERYFRINRGQKGTGPIIQTLETKTLIECGYMCLETYHCKASNFQEEDHTCELLSSNTTELATNDTVLTCQPFK